jgi:chemotaxis signal transduction protein
MTQLDNAELLNESVTTNANEPIARYVVVGIYQNRYGINTNSTVELMDSDVAQITRVPHSPEFISGVINHRGSIIPVIDTRRLLGFSTNESEINAMLSMLDAREQDHVAWLEELRRCVKSGDEFTLDRDPNMCAFGKWHNEIAASNAKMEYFTKGDATLRGLFDHFGTPHERIHAIADKVLSLTSEDNRDEALQMIQRVWDTDLASMRQLFSQVRESIKKTHAAMMVITEIGSRKAALLVDTVYTVKDVPLQAIESCPESAENQQFLNGLVHQPDGSYILIVDLESIYDTACPVEVAANA